MSKQLPTFEVDKAGLAKLLERKGKHFAVAELIQNSWDEDVANVAVVLKKGREDGLYTLQVADDNPEGFADLTHAYTLFAESAKKDDPEKRGRFNLGEKLVIAMCEYAIIETTKGKIEFGPQGRVFGPEQTDAGSVFSGVVRLTAAEASEVEQMVHRLIPPAGVKTTFNGAELAHRTPLATFEVSLRTERADAEGYLRPTTRKTNVSVYEPLEAETGALYELGIPVVESGDTYHVDVGQKVPLNTDRDNVPPSFLRDIRAAVLNAMHQQIDEEAITENWIDNALEDASVEAKAVQSVVSGRYGDKVVTADPSDREAEKIAVSEGYTVIPAGAFSKLAWKNVKGADAVLPAGKVTPSPDPSAGEDTLDFMEPAHWPENVQVFVAYAKVLSRRVLGVTITVRVAQPKKAGDWPYKATWGRRSSTNAELTLNFAALGYAFFEEAVSLEHGKFVLSERAHELLIHEFAHQYASEHLSREFYDACCKVGAKLATDPDLLGDTHRIQVPA